MNLMTDTKTENDSPLSSPNKKRAFNLLPAGIITVAFLIFTSLPAFYSSAGIWATPLAVLLTLSACVLVFAPGIALLTLLGNKIPASLSPGIVILGSAVSGWLLFWAWFAHPHAGMVASLTVSAAAMLVLSSRPVTAAWKRISLPATVSVIVCIGYISLAGDRGGLDYDQLIAGRYWAVLDNSIPRLFADCLINDKAGLKPVLLADWHSSDRPPLQTGMLMVAYPFVNQAGGSIAYLLLAVVINIFWIWGLWGFLRAVGLTERKILQVTILVILVGAVFVNSVYVWPKMLAAALAFTAGTALLLSDCSKRIRALVVGSAAALSLLAHGAALFALLGFVTLFWVRRKEWPIREILMTAAVAALLYLPWMAYQKFYDPPGDRLIKWHLAGLEPVNESRSPFKTIVEEYTKSGIQGFAANKLHNLRMLLGDPTDWNGACARGYAHPGWNDTLAGRMREFFLLRFGPAPTLLLIGLPLLFVPKVRQAIWFKPLSGVLLTTLVTFWFFEFGSTPSSSTWLCHAPYTALLLWCGLCALAISELGDKWFFIFLPLHLILFFALWDYNVAEWSAGQPPAFPGQPDFVARLLALFSFLALVAMFLRSKQWASETDLK
jgi:hypothetical protein